MIAARSSGEWARFLADHMPQGYALDLAEGGLFARTFEALAVELGRFDSLCDTLLLELDPGTTSELISDWERMLDLPRACQTPSALLSQRRAFVAAVLTRGRDLSPATLIEAAALYGFTITVKEYFPESVPADLPLSNRFKYEVTTSAALTVIPFTTGVSQAGDPLGKVEQADLSCLLTEIQPAYAELTFAP